MKKIIICVILSTLVLLSSCSAMWDYLPIKKKEELTTGVETIETDEYEDTIDVPEEPIVENKNDVYDSIIADYKLMVEYRLSKDFSEEKWGENLPQLSEDLEGLFLDEEFGYQWYCMYVELPQDEKSEDKNYYGYIFCDLNGDGIDELFLVRKDYSIVAIFTIVANRVQLVNAFWSRYRGWIDENGNLATFGSSGASDNVYAVYSINLLGKLEAKCGFYCQSNWESEDEKVEFYKFFGDNHTKITQEKYDELLEEYPFESSESWLNKPIIPLFD